jgi:hypothetical protein
VNIMMGTVEPIGDTQRMARNELRAEIRLSWDGGDPWGSTLSVLCGVSDVLVHRGFADRVPTGLEYRTGSDVEDQPAAHYLDLLDQGAITVDALAYWARVLDRFANLVPDADVERWSQRWAWETLGVDVHRAAED